MSHEELFAANAHSGCAFRTASPLHQTRFVEQFCVFLLDLNLSGHLIWPCRSDCYSSLPDGRIDLYQVKSVCVRSRFVPGSIRFRSEVEKLCQQDG
jgi:hypothetical protein